MWRAPIAHVWERARYWRELLPPSRPTGNIAVNQRESVSWSPESQSANWPKSATNGSRSQVRSRRMYRCQESIDSVWQASCHWRRQAEKAFWLGMESIHDRLDG